MTSKLMAIHWWSLPFIAVGMLESIFVNVYQGFTVLGMILVISFVIRLIKYKFKKSFLKPYWSTPILGLIIYDYFKVGVNETIILSVTFIIVVAVFSYLAYKTKQKGKVICDKCGRETWTLPDGQLPFNHRTGQCKVSKQESHK